MKKLALFLAFILLVGIFAGCKGAEEAGANRSIENADGTLSDWMKEEIEEAYKKKMFEEHGIENITNFGGWWEPENPINYTRAYYGTYNGYIMYCYARGAEAYMSKTIAGYEFTFPTIHEFYAYKDGEFYDLEELLSQGLIDEKAIKIAYDAHRRIIEITREYKDQKNK
ncbi:MAG: hypothetical protein E7439_03850 [Ruminococcaceae bacterium]|nr:hypothetical protein [Oscillospiraceae bacterium]